MTGPHMEVGPAQSNSYQTSRSDPATAPERQLDRVGGIQINVDVAKLSSPELDPAQRDAILLNRAAVLNGASAYASMVVPGSEVRSTPIPQGSSALQGRSGISTADAAREIHAAVAERVRNELHYLDNGSAERLAQDAASLAANTAVGREGELDRAPDRVQSNEPTHRPWRFTPTREAQSTGSENRPDTDRPDRSFDPLWSATPQQPLTQQPSLHEPTGARLSLYQAPGLSATDQPVRSAFDAVLRAKAESTPNVSTDIQDGPELAKQDSRTVLATEMPTALEVQLANSLDTATESGPFRISHVRGHATFVPRARAA